MKGYFGVQRAAMPAGAAQPLTERERALVREAYERLEDARARTGGAAHRAAGGPMAG